MSNAGSVRHKRAFSYGSCASHARSFNAHENDRIQSRCTGVPLRDKSWGFQNGIILGTEGSFILYSTTNRLGQDWAFKYQSQQTMDGASTSSTVPKTTPQPLHVDRILTRKPDAPISSVEDLFCELPSCDLVSQSRLESHRCGSLGKSSPPRPLLITSTPRSATVYMQTSLRDHGMQIQDDWHQPLRDGRVSWMHAFDDTDQDIATSCTKSKNLSRALPAFAPNRFLELELVVHCRSFAVTSPSRAVI